LRKRIENLCKPIKYDYVENKRSANYYIILDLLEISQTLYGKKFSQWIHEHIDPLDIIFILAKKYSTVCLPGVGFAAPPWSIRISLANLQPNDYILIGKNIKNTIDYLYNLYNLKK
jgi:aspartate 4-decarboxylase